LQTLNPPRSDDFVRFHGIKHAALCAETTLHGVCGRVGDTLTSAQTNCKLGYLKVHAQTYQPFLQRRGASEKWRLKFTQDHYILTAFCNPYFHMDNYSRVFSRERSMTELGKLGFFLMRETRIVKNSWSYLYFFGKNCNL
jgi:hypothetical protein